MKRTLFTWLLCLVLCLTPFANTTPVSAAATPDAVDVTACSSFSTAGTTYKKAGRALQITATTAGAELALVLEKALPLSEYGYWVGRIQSTVPFDIVFYNPNDNNWIFAAADFCYAFENNNGSSAPLPAGNHTATIDLRTAYTYSGNALPADAVIKSITFIAKSPGTITVPLCEMRSDSHVAAAPDATYVKDGQLLKSIPTNHTVSSLCNGVRYLYDATSVSVTHNNGTTASKTDIVGTDATITLRNDGQTETLKAVVRGDVSGDGRSTTSDVRNVVLHALGAITLSDAQFTAGNMINDAVVNTSDARTMLLQVLQPNTMQFTQTSVVSQETFTSQDAYRTFLNAATRDLQIGGLPQDLVPQGMAQCHANGLTYISSYSGSGGGSAILVYDQAGRLQAEYHIYNQNGSRCTKHLGGIAVTDTTLFVSYDGDSAYRVAAWKLTDLMTFGTHSLYIDQMYELPVSTSFLSYYDGYLWAGNFYLPSSGYGLMRELNTTMTVNGEEYGCYIAGYKLGTKGDARLIPQSGERYATPDVVLSAGQKVQGMAYDPATKTVILSHSWGRHNNSSLAFYTVDFAKSATATVTLNGTKVSCYALATPTKTVITMPMTEGITLDGYGGVRVLYESGANKYSDGTHRTDHVWNYRY